MINNKRGNFVDIPDYIVSALIVGFSLTIAFLILINFNTGVNANSNIPSVVKSGSDDFNTAFFKMDYISVILYIGFLGFSVVSARLIPSSSKFIIIPVITMILMPFIGFFIENVWSGWYNTSVVSTIGNRLFWTNLVLDNLGLLSLVYSFFVGIALVSKDEVQR